MMKKRNKKYKPRLLNIPVMPEMRGLIATQLYASMVTLNSEPTTDAFDAIASIFNMIAVVIHKDERFEHENRLINGGMNAMNQMAGKVTAIGNGKTIALHAYELQPVKIAAVAVDEILPKLNLLKLQLANMEINRL